MPSTNLRPGWATWAPVLALALLACCTLAACRRGGAGSQQPIWAQAGGDAAHSGRSEALGPRKGTVLWSWSLPADTARTGVGMTLEAGPTVGPDGTVYVISSGEGAALWAISADGTLKWQLPLSGSMGWGPTATPVVLPDGGILVVCSEGLACVDPSGAIAGILDLPAPAVESAPTESTAPAPRVRRGATPSTAPALGPDGAIYVGSATRLVALGADGAARWQTPLPRGTACLAPAVASDGSVYVGQAIHPPKGQSGRVTGAVSAFDAAGQCRWTVDGSSPMSALALAPDGAVLVGWTDAVAAYDPQGHERWRFTGGSEAIAVSADGSVLAAGRRTLVCLSPAGELRWQRPYESGRPAAAVDRSGNAYVRLEGQVFSADPTRKLRWVAGFPDAPAQGAFVQGNHRTGIALTDRGRIYACSPQSLYAIDDK